MTDVGARVGSFVVALVSAIALGCFPQAQVDHASASQSAVVSSYPATSAAPIIPQSPAGRESISRRDELMFQIPREFLGKNVVIIERVAEVTPRSTHDLYPGKVIATRKIRPSAAAGTLPLHWNAETMAPRRSSLRFAHTFGDRVELEVEHQFADRSVTVHWSMLLQRAPMQPRLADWRVPYFTMPAPAALVDDVAAAAAPGDPTRDQIIYRFRLEKKSPDAAMSEVVKPIIFYIDPKTPKRFIPWIKRGVDLWQPAFEAIGFRNAIEARETPTKAADPTWSFNDAAHNVIRWVSSGEENANGGATAFDQETGEIFTAQVTLYGGLESLMQRVGFALLGGVPDIVLPFPDSIMGELITMVTTHEVGHAIGFPHNFKGASAYPTDSARSKSFVQRMGYSASLMDYSYFNFLAQPEDGLSFTQRHAKIGPYDVFALGWGYRPIPGANSPVAELPTLEQWRKAQDTAAYLRASVQQAMAIDPGDQPDDIGTNLTKSAAMAVKNFARTGARLVAMRKQLESKPGSIPSSTVDAAGEPRWTPEVDVDMISSYQDEVLHRWTLALTHAAGAVGGVIPKAPYAGDQDQQQLVPMDSTRQVTALRFVLDHVFRAQDEFVQTEFASAATPIKDAASLLRADSLPNGWKIDLFHSKQLAIMNQFLDQSRLTRIAEQAPTTGVLPVFCSELDQIGRELTPAIEETMKTSTKDMLPLLEMLEQIRSAITSEDGMCRSNGWKPAP